MGRFSFLVARLVLELLALCFYSIFVIRCRDFSIFDNSALLGVGHDVTVPYYPDCIIEVSVRYVFGRFLQLV